MSDVTRILDAIEQGDEKASELKHENESLNLPCFICRTLDYLILLDD